VTTRPLYIPVLLGVLLFAEASAEQAEIDEVLVTATRRTISTAEVSSALTLVDGAVARTPKLVTDALDTQVGVFLQQTTPGQGAAIIRGLKGSAVLHLVDGIRLNNAIFRSAPTQYFALVPTSAVERIEVLRGTPASLYGSDAVGGVVQLVTRVPEFDGPETQMGGEAFAAFDSAELGKIVRGTFDAGNQDLATSISAEYMETGDRRTGSGERVGPSGYESKAARWVLSGTPTASRSWLVDAHYLEQPETPRVDELVPGFGQTEPSSSEFLFAPNRRVFVRGHYGLEQGWLDLDWNFDLAWQRVDDDRTTRDFGATERRRETNRSDLYGFVVSGSRVTGNGSFVVGAETYLDDVSSSRTEENLFNGEVTILTPRFPDGSEINRFAAFGNGEWSVTVRHVLTGGLRLSHEDVSLPQTAVSPSVSVDVADASGDIGWIFNTTDSLQFVANAGFGFRAPNVFDLGTLGNRPGNRFNIPNTDLDSERVVQFDIGFRYRSDMADLEIMLYALDYDDRITSVLTGDVTPEGRDIVQSVNAAESTIRGAEAGVDVLLSDTVSINAVLNYTWGEQRVVGEATEPADRIPPLTGKLNVAWQPRYDLRLDGWVRFADGQDRLSARDVRDVRIDPNGTSGWGIVGLRASWDYRDVWQFTLGVDNVLDKQYRVHGSGMDAPGQNAYVTVRRVW
jgi:outer membrane receptor for ferrienterochelin and colicin